jgi:hypothetical protein
LKPEDARSDDPHSLVAGITMKTDTPRKLAASKLWLATATSEFKICKELKLIDG